MDHPGPLTLSKHKIKQITNSSRKKFLTFPEKNIFLYFLHSRIRATQFLQKRIFLSSEKIPNIPPPLPPPKKNKIKNKKFLVCVKEPIICSAHKFLRFIPQKNSN